MSDVFPDTEGALRTWLRGKTLAGQRVFFGVPKKADETTFPLVVVSRVGGGEDSSEAAFDLATIQFDCWGNIDTDSGFSKKATATALKNSVRSALHDLLGGGTALNASVRCDGAEILSDVWFPDPSDDRPRYVLTAQVVAIAV